MSKLVIPAQYAEDAKFTQTIYTSQEIRIIRHKLVNKENPNDFLYYFSYRAGPRILDESAPEHLINRLFTDEEQRDVYVRMAMSQPPKHIFADYGIIVRTENNKSPQGEI